MITFDGHEPDIYRLEGPHQLLGAGGEILKNALRPGETVLYFLTCPRWECTRPAFDIRAPHASHVLCLTPSRLLIWRNHIPQQQRDESSVVSVAWDRLIGFEFGEELLMSWLVLYIQEDKVVKKEGFLFPQHGNQHVAALMRTWRESWPVHRPWDGSPELSWISILKQAGYFHERLLQPLLVGGERLLRADQRTPVWGEKSGWFRSEPAGVANWGTILLTDRAFFYIHGEIPQRQGSYVFAHNLHCYPLAALHRSQCRAIQKQGVLCPTIRLVVGGKGGSQLEIPFCSEQAALADHWLENLRIAMKRAK